MMTKTSYSLAFVFLMFLALLSCSDDELTGSGTIITEELNLPAFTQVDAQDVMTVNISEGAEQLVELTVNENLRDKIIIEVDNGTLKLSLASGSFSNATFEAQIQLPTLEKVALNDNTDGMVDFTTDQLRIEVSEAASLSLQGSANTLTTITQDAAKIDGFSFTTDILETSSSDASELNISCTSTLNGTVSDAAKVFYKGMPSNNISLSDNGQVIDAN